MDLQNSKKILRTQMRAALQQISAESRAAASANARALLEQQKLWKQAQSLLFFAPMPEELDLWPLAADALTAGKMVALPKFVAETNTYIACQIHELAGSLKTGQFGIREPADHCARFPIKRLDLILVPGLAFDLQGRRLGRGKGFYDQLLAVVRGPACGVAFDEQIVDRLPVGPQDVSVNCILTPTRWIEL